MIDSAVAYVTAVVTALVLGVSGAAVASQGNDSSLAVEEAAPTTLRPTTTTSTTTSTSTTSTTSTTLAPAPVVIPALGGLTEAQAMRALRAEGLDVTSSEVDAVVGYAIDVVVASEPPEGTSVLPGDTVNVVVGRRPSANLIDRAVPIAWNEIDSIDTVDVSVGRCSVGRQDGSLLTLDFADCDGPHDFQYLARIDLVESFSTGDEAAAALRAACVEAFGDFVGARIAGSDLDLQLVLDWESGIAGADGQCLIIPLLGGLQIVGDAAGSLW